MKKNFIKKHKKASLPLLLISIILIVFITTIGVSGLLTTKKEITTTAQTTDFTQYVNVVQGPGAPTNNDRQVFMRYPLGRIGLWSRSTGEIPDSITRGVKIYPVIDQMVAKDITDWRGTIVGSPSKTDITYLPASPAKGSTVSMTVTPNLSIYKYHFTGASSFGAVGITLGETNYTGTWPTRNVTVVDNQTIQATIGNSNHTIYYLIKFSVPGSGSGSGGQGYMKFGSGVNDVTVAVALSHTSFATAQQFFSKEFSDFNFDAAVQRLKDAWNEKLGKIDIQNGDQLTKQILYTALYTVYANIIDSSDGSVYSAAAATYGSRFLTIGSSPGWAYIGGGYLRCIWDQGRDVYHLLSLIDPPVLKELLHGYMM